MHELSGVILSAGLSSRMGAFKPLIEVDGIPMIAHVIRGMRGCGASPIVIVTGYRREELEAALAGEKGLRFVFNPNYASTQQLDSLRLALAALSGETKRAVISPADVPLVSAETYARLRDTDGDFVRPLWRGHGGHPVFLRAEWFPYLLAYNGPGGLRGAMEQSGGTLVNVGVEDRGTVLDNDTPEDVVRLLDWAAGKPAASAP